jgi:hypothetical protein
MAFKADIVARPSLGFLTSNFGGFRAANPLFLVPAKVQSPPPSKVDLIHDHGNLTTEGTIMK